MSLAREARMLEAARPSFFDRADQLGAMIGAKSIERPQMIGARRFKLERPVWPDCPLCGATVEDCECDPDAYQAAVLAERAKGGAA